MVEKSLKFSQWWMSSKFLLPPFFLLLICTSPSLLFVVVITPFVCNHEKDDKEQHKGEAPYPPSTFFQLLMDNENHGDREAPCPSFFLALNVVMLFLLSTPIHIEKERAKDKGKERGEKHGKKHGEKRNIGLLSKR
jgi:hypothetical protein